MCQEVHEYVDKLIGHFILGMCPYLEEKLQVRDINIVQEECDLSMIWQRPYESTSGKDCNNKFED